MKTLLTYLAGVVTVLLVQSIPGLIYAYRDWRWHRRYQRMWDKASAEFDSMDTQSLAACKSKWEEAPWRYEKWADDRSRYFDMRWQYGNTTEV